MKKGMVRLSLVPFLCEVYILLTEEAEQQFRKKFKVEMPTMDDRYGALCWDFGQIKNKYIIAIQLPDSQEYSHASNAGLLSHEATHALQIVKRSCSFAYEETESEAYIVQAIVEKGMMAIDKLKKSKEKK